MGCTQTKGGAKHRSQVKNGEEIAEQFLKDAMVRLKKLQQEEQKQQKIKEAIQQQQFNQQLQNLSSELGILKFQSKYDVTIHPSNYNEAQGQYQISTQNISEIQDGGNNNNICEEVSEKSYQQ